MENKQIMKNQPKNSISGLGHLSDDKIWSNIPNMFEVPFPPLNVCYNASLNNDNFEFNQDNSMIKNINTKLDSMMLYEGESFKLQDENRNLEYIFNFDSTPQKIALWKIEPSFNFPLEYSFPELIRSFKNEESAWFEFTDSPKCKSQDEIYAMKSKSNKDAHVQELEDRIKSATGLNTVLNTVNLDLAKLNRNDNINKLSLSTPVSSVSEEKLKSLLEYLRKTKGVNIDYVNDDIISKTIEFGQRKTAGLLNIPFRRYKSILSRVGIRSNAGRKIKSWKFEEELALWAIQIKNKNQILTRSMIMDKANKIMNVMIDKNESKLKANRLSKGWLDKFLKRHSEIKGWITSQKGKKSKL